MYFLQMAQAPLVVQVEKDRIAHVPKFTGRDFGEWATELMAERTAQQTNDLSGPTLAEFLALYPPTEPSWEELRRLARTTTGAKRIIRTSLMKSETKWFDASNKPAAAMHPDKIEGMLEAVSAPRLIQLSVRLADLDDDLSKDPNQKPEEKRDPLSRGKKGGSPPLPVTGEKSSLSSEQPTTLSL